MPDAGAAGAAGAAEPGGSLTERVVRAMTTGLVTRTDSLTPGMVAVPAGEPVTATHEEESGEITVRFHVRETEIATRTLRVEERTRQVMLGAFHPTKYEQRYNGFQTLTDLHQQFAEGLAGADCVLRVTLSDEDAHVWAPYFDWARGLGNLNATNLEQAVEAIYQLARNQTVWDAQNLSERVRLIAGPDDSGQPGNWRHLIATTTPAQLVAGIDAISPGLSRVVLIRMACWHGMRAIA
jgi:hypothetical protein